MLEYDRTKQEGPWANQGNRGGGGGNTNYPPQNYQGRNYQGNQWRRDYNNDHPCGGYQGNQNYNNNNNQGHNFQGRNQGGALNQSNQNKQVYMPPHIRQTEAAQTSEIGLLVAELARTREEMEKYRASTDNQIKSLMMQINQNNVPGRQPGNLPSTTEPNPREHVQAITLRSGRQTTEDKQKNSEEEETPSMTTEKHTDAPTEKSMEPTRPNTKVTIVKPSLLFPSRVRNDDDSRKCNKFLDLLKQRHVNLPLMDALAELPKYAKFFKDLLTKNRQLQALSVVDLNAECSAVVLRSIPEKLKDPGSFTIPCSIDNFNFINALADLGASINLMPSSIVENLGLGEMKPTRMCLQLADRSVKYPKGIVEDVLVKVDKFIFPVHFVVMDMEEDREKPLILGRPFLATARALIDVTDGSLTLRVEDDLCTFRLSNVMKHPTDSFQGCHFLDTFESIEGYLFGEENGHVSDKACLLKEANGDMSDACESCEDAIIEQASHEVLS
ncbi:unnamed protein product [Cuscuta europaea]|uniref:Reverse transcriptase domain-containing protein n=1 Tax=Cuscuta europaea TaxID=41803 RepID=A0A9P0YPZ9_CUSEU|nr:unnamed protein product [Cuscuta europaea]